MNMKHTCFASVVSISEIQQSEIYMTVKAVMFETPGANLNGVRVTAAFLDEIIANEDKYVGIPLYADARNLAMGNYEHLGHLYDAKTGEFHSTQIGSFYKYEKVQTAEGFALVGYARIMKRNMAICKAIAQLFASGALKFSFEICCGACETLEDGTMQIDADPTNYLEGMAVVTFPACESAVALQLVAECEKLANDNQEDVISMNDVTIDTVEIAEVVISETEVEVAEAPAEEAVESAECEKEVASEEVASEEVASEETAENDSEEVNCAENEEDKPVEDEEETVEVKAEKCNDPECEIDHAEAEAEEAEEEVCAACGCKKSECSCIDFAARFAEIEASIDSLKDIIAELTKEKETSAETVIAQIENSEIPMNPMTSDIHVTTKYTLLESVAPKSNSKYSLLDRA